LQRCVACVGAAGRSRGRARRGEIRRDSHETSARLLSSGEAQA
jgi:hypothetical protein